MVRWKEFAGACPDLAEIGKRHLHRPGQGEVALLATVDGLGNPRIAPVCPIFTDHGVYLSIGAHTPKQSHLQQRGSYALHAQVAADDEEFQISGPVRRITDGGELDTVFAAIPFPTYDRSDPVYELLIDRALLVTWPSPGAPEKRAWSASSRNRAS